MKKLVCFFAIFVVLFSLLSVSVFAFDDFERADFDSDSVVPIDDIVSLSDDAVLRSVSSTNYFDYSSQPIPVVANSGNLVADYHSSLVIATASPYYFAVSSTSNSEVFFNSYGNNHYCFYSFTPASVRLFKYVSDTSSQNISYSRRLTYDDDYHIYRYAGNFDRVISRFYCPNFTSLDDSISSFLESTKPIVVSQSNIFDTFLSIAGDVASFLTTPFILVFISVPCVFVGTRLIRKFIY